MDELRAERWGAASGYLVFALGIVGMAFERGAPPATAPAAESLAFFVRYRGELLAQSLSFVFSAGIYLWFFGALRAFLARAEGGAGSVSTTAFAAGAVWAALQMVLQSVQIALAMGARGLEPALAGMMGDLSYAISVVAYVPLAVVLAAVAVLSLKASAFPRWLGWFSAAFALANVVMALGIVVDHALLVPGGVLTYVLYLMLPIWLLAVTTVMVRRLGRGGLGQTRYDTPPSATVPCG